MLCERLPRRFVMLIAGGMDGDVLNDWLSFSTSNWGGGYCCRSKPEHRCRYRGSVPSHVFSFPPFVSLGYKFIHQQTTSILLGRSIGVDHVYVDLSLPSAEFDAHGVGRVRLFQDQAECVADSVADVDLFPSTSHSQTDRERFD